MKLDFSTLSRPKAPPPSLKAWGQVGTAGTAISMRSSARSDSGDAAGTSGDAHPHDPACPQVSPDCPHPSTACKPNSHAVSPMSPGVPTYLKQSAKASSFNVVDTQVDVLALTDGVNLDEADAIDPDRHSWPHTLAMNSAEIDSFNARVQLFTRHALDQTQAEGVADGLVIRDRDGDDRRLCLECQHLRGGGRSWACNQWRAAGHGAAGIPADMVLMLQRCDGFKEMTR